MEIWALDFGLRDLGLFIAGSIFGEPSNEIEKNGFNLKVSPICDLPTQF